VREAKLSIRGGCAHFCLPPPLSLSDSFAYQSFVRSRALKIQLLKSYLSLCSIPAAGERVHVCAAGRRFRLTLDASAESAGCGDRGATTNRSSFTRQKTKSPQRRRVNSRAFPPLHHDPGARSKATRATAAALEWLAVAGNLRGLASR